MQKYPPINEVRSQKSEVRSQKSEVVFETEIYAPFQKLCALKGGVLDPTIFDKLLEGEPVWLAEINLGIGREIGVYQGVEREWLYWYNQEGKRYLTSQEKAKQAQKQVLQAQERAKLLEARLRSLGVDPNEL